MSYLDALSLYGGDWNTYMAANSETELDYTLYVAGNPVPDYYYSDAPTDTTLSSTYTSGFGVTTGTPQHLSDDQADLITYYLSATSDIAYRVSFSDVSTLTFHQNNSPDATGEIFISAGNIGDADTMGATDRPSGSTSTEGDFVGDVVLSDNGTAGTSGLSASTVMSQLGTSQAGAYAILHELGHAVGLIHTTDAGYTGALAIYNSQKYSIMTEAVSDSDPDMDSSVHPTGLQLLDIAVLQSMYGVNWGGVNGEGGANENTVYSHVSSFTTSNAYGGFIYTIWDGAGVDVIDATGYTTPAEIDLRQGHFSSIGYQGDSANTPVAGDTGVGTLSEYDAGNVAIAYFTVIENAIGTSGADTLIGNAWNNVLFGGDGNDKIYGDGATYDGDAGPHAANANADSSSTVYGWGPDAVAPATDLSGNDVLIGGYGDDYFYGGLGNDVIHGGYVQADIDGAASGWDAAGEFTGTNNANGVALTDISYSADGTDTVDYSQLPEGTSGSAGIAVTFLNTYASNPITVDKGYAAEYGSDSLFSIEKIIGTPWNDTFSGSSYSGLPYIYGSKGADSYDGNFEIDYSLLSPLSGHIEATLNGSGGTVDKYNTGGSLGVDTLSTAVSDITGTSGDDTFTGFNPGQITNYSGGAGNDVYTFDLATLATSGSVFITEDANGNFSNVLTPNFDAATMTSTLEDFQAIPGFEYWMMDIAKWDSTTSSWDVLEIQFEKNGVTSAGVDSFVVGSQTYEFGGFYNDNIIGATGDHIIDGGSGINTIDYGAAPAGVTVDLSAGTASNGWGYSDTLANIQNVTGSSHNDTITGDSNDNVLAGGAGNDTIDGGGGVNTVDYSGDPAGVTVNLSTGTATDGWGGTDTLSDIQNVNGSAYADTITGDSNNNVLSGGAGNDTIDGGTGTNTVDYSHDPAGVTVDLSAGTATDGWGGSDTLLNIQNVTGSTYDDTITGDSNANVLVGGDGNDTLSGGGGNDTLDGGSGNNALDGGTGTNTVDYSHDPGSVYVDLSSGFAFNGYGGTDTLTNIQNIVGSAYGSTIIGDNNDNSLTGGDGNDWLAGNGGNDVIDGGGGINTVDYSGDPAGVTVDLSAGTATDGWSGSDTLSNIQNIVGSYYDDILTGDSHDNVFVGNGGDNIIDGGGGINTIDYSNDPAGVTVDMSAGTATNGYSGSDTLSHIQIVIGSHYDDSITGDGTTTVSYANANSGVTIDLSAGTATGDGSDTLINIHSVIGSAYDDSITGSSSDDIISGGGGNNIIDGGGGVNTVDYSHDPSGVFVDLSIGSVTNGNGGTDTLSNIQNVIGSAYDDWITGDSNDNVISGGAGNNNLDGGDGVNTVDYSHAAAGVTVDLSLGVALDNGSGGSDFLANFQSVIGSHYDDSITGDGTTTVSYETALTGVTVDLSAGTATGDGSDTLSGIANVTGSSHDDTITGDSNDNVLYGNGGNDYITGGAGADTFLFKGATAETGVTTIADFNTTDGDKLDIADLIPTYDPSTDPYQIAINNFVELTTSGGDTQVKVDTDGSGTSYTQIATLSGVTGLNVSDLITDGNLIVHHT
jgi:Ca2+-binding RTX toxin-like protein